MPVDQPLGQNSLPARYFQGTASNYVYNAVSLIVAVALTPVLVRALGQEGYGIWVLASSLILYLDLFQFGFAQSTITYFARAKANDDTGAIRRITTTAFLVLAGAGLLAFLLAVVLALVLPGILDLTGSSASDMRTVMIVSAAAFSLSIPSDTFGGILSGLQRYDLLFASLSLTIVAQAMGNVLVIWSGGGLIGLAIISGIVAVGGQLSRVWLAKRLVGDLRIRTTHFDRTLIRPLASLSFWFSVRDVAIVLVERIDTVVVGFVVGVPAAAVYSVGQRLVLFIGRLVRPLSWALLPFAAELSELGDETRTRQSVLTGTRLSMLVALPLCLTMALFASPVLHAWVGDGYDDAVLVVVYLSIAEVLSALLESSSSVLRGRAEAKPVALVAVGEAGLNLVLSLVLGSVMGVEGVALATLIARATVQIGMFLPYSLRRLDIRVGDLGRAAVLGQLIPLAVAAVVGLAARSWAESGEVIRLAAGAGATMATFVVIVLFSGFSSYERGRLLTLLPSRQRGR